MSRVDQCSRSYWLRALLALDRPLDRIESALRAFPWDCDHDLAILSAADARTVLQRGVDAELSCADLSRWAELIESREDLAYEEAFQDELSQLIIELANPTLFEPLTKEVFGRWLLRLNR